MSNTIYKVAACGVWGISFTLLIAFTLPTDPKLPSVTQAAVSPNLEIPNSSISPVASYEPLSPKELSRFFKAEAEQPIVIKRITPSSEPVAEIINKDLRVTGVMTIDGKDQYAIYDSKRQIAFTLFEGAVVDDWLCSKVDTNFIYLKKDKKVQKVKLHE